MKSQLLPKTVDTFCAYRLGDNLAHLHFLRALAKQHPEILFTHACHLCYMDQLSEVVWDLPNLRLIPLEYKPAESVDVWKNAAGFWESHLLKNNYGRFYCAFFHHLAELFGLESPLKEPGDLLFDYPAIRKEQKLCDPFDVLVINSRPLSNQWSRYSEPEMTSLISCLARKLSVITTQPSRLGVPCAADKHLTVTSIGTLSLSCKYIVGASTGPSWPTFNIWNKETVKRRVILLDNEDVNIAPNTVCCKTVGDAKKMLELEGVI
jgi:hypothetical protein